MTCESEAKKSAKFNQILLHNVINSLVKWERNETEERNISKRDSNKSNIISCEQRNNKQKIRKINKKPRVLCYIHMWNIFRTKGKNANAKEMLKISEKSSTKAKPKIFFFEVISNFFPFRSYNNQKNIFGLNRWCEENKVFEEHLKIYKPILFGRWYRQWFMQY